MRKFSSFLANSFSPQLSLLGFKRIHIFTLQRWEFEWMAIEGLQFLLQNILKEGLETPSSK